MEILKISKGFDFIFYGQSFLVANDQVSVLLGAEFAEKLVVSEVIKQGLT